MDKPKGIIQVSDSLAFLSGTGRLVRDVHGQTTDRELLTEMAGSVQLAEGLPVTSGVALSAIIADTILKLGIKDGAKLVAPAAGLVQRNLRVEDPVDPRKPMEDDTLFYLRKQMLERPDFGTKFRLAMALGDRGLHYAAGVGGKHLKRMHSPDYAREMAGVGYGCALDMAEARPDHPAALSVRATVPELASRPEEVIAILRGMMEERVLERFH